MFSKEFSNVLFLIQIFQHLFSSKGDLLKIDKKLQKKPGNGNNFCKTAIITM